MMCGNCGAPAHHIHHIVPKALGGSDRPGNLAPLCEACHGLVHGRDFVRHKQLSKAGQDRAKASGKHIGRRKTYTPEQAKLVHELRNKGTSFRAISQQVGLSLGAVQRILESSTVKTPCGRRKSYTPEQAELGQQLHGAGDTLLAIAKKVNLSVGTVQRVLAAEAA